MRICKEQHARKAPPKVATLKIVKCVWGRMFGRLDCSSQPASLAPFQDLKLKCWELPFDMRYVASNRWGLSHLEKVLENYEHSFGADHFKQ